MKGYRSEEIIGQDFPTFYTGEDIQRGRPDQELKTGDSRERCEEEGWLALLGQCRHYGIIR